MAGGLLPGPGGFGGGGKLRRSSVPMSEINVTPLVDVMLVLLIIFMVAAPLLTTGVEVELPETDAEAVTEEVEPLSISVTADGTIYVQETEIAYDDLVEHLRAISQAGYDQQIYIRGDRNVPYDDVMKVLGRVQAAGFKNFALITD
ncbi:MAG: protein TolR [Pseudomonadota bacterium]